MKRGKFVIIFGPTGSGKNELIKAMRAAYPDIGFVGSYTTRERRPSDENASYSFIGADEFLRMSDAGEFIEWAEFSSNYYGTMLKEVQEGLAAGKVVLKEMETQGIAQVLEKLPREDLLIMFVDAGDWETLERRARDRAPITDEALAKRRAHFVEEVAFAKKVRPDVIVKNPDGKLEDAKAAAVEAVRAVITA